MSSASGAIYNSGVGPTTSSSSNYGASVPSVNTSSTSSVNSNNPTQQQQKASGVGTPIVPSKPPLLFVIVGINEPLYEAELNQHPTTTITADSITRQNYFVLHSALDLVDKAEWTTNQMYLKVVDKVNQQEVSTFVTAGNIKFMLLHNGKNEDAIKNFFTEVYENYVKLLMNPFTKYDAPITSKSFDSRVRSIGRRYLA